MPKNYFTYILASKRNGTLYVGVTNDLLGRIYQHKQGKIKSFTKKYQIDRLVYYEECGDINSAITREKRLKRWNRKWKLEIIEEFNPNWEDLYYKLLQGFDSGSLRPRRTGCSGRDETPSRSQTTGQARRVK